MTEIYPTDPDIAFGLCDLGMGLPELGEVRLSDLAAYRGDPPESIYPAPVGNASLYLSADRDQIVGPDTIMVGTTVFYLGFRRSDRHASP